MFTTRPEILGTFGVAASTHWLASATAMAVLEEGGNAFDAAVAAGFALQVVEPHLNGPGGDMPALVWSAAEQRLRVVCGQGPAPAAATVGAFRGLGLDIVPGTGLLATCVPGAVDAWLSIARDYGTMDLARLLRPAIEFAGGGYPLVGHAVATIASVEALFREEWPTSAAVYLPGGRLPEAGKLFRNPTLARTWTRVVAEAEAAGGSREDRIEAARRIFQEGFVAEAIADFAAGNEVMDSSGRRHRGLLAGDDMANWRASFEEPLTYDYGRYRVAKAGPWSQAPVFLQQLALLKGFDLAGMDPLGADFAHVVVECAKLAFADREAFYGDPAHVDVPMERLLSDDYSDARRKLVGAEASREIRPGALDGFASTVRVGERRGPALGAGEPTMAQTGRRHLPSRCDRPLGQYGLGDALRRLAAELAGHSLARLLPRLAHADVLAGGGPARLPRAGETAPHHAQPLIRLPRRRALDGFRHAGRRRAGPVVADLLPAPCPPRPEPPGGDRCADLPEPPFPVVLLSAPGRPRPARRGGAPAGGHRCRACRARTRCGGRRPLEHWADQRLRA